MAKSKTVYICPKCHKAHNVWAAKCSDCGEFDLIEQEVRPETKATRLAGAGSTTSLRASGAPAMVQPLREASRSSVDRISTGISSFDFMIGGGIVPGSILLIGGEPGIGKSTVLTQIAGNLIESGSRVLYASGEESVDQTRMRAERLGDSCLGIDYTSETDVTQLVEVARALRPTLLVVDSIQTMYVPDVGSAPGGIAQVQASSDHLRRFAKANGVVVALVGQVTKDGAIAGPKTLEHLVDTVIYAQHMDAEHRLFRCTKNRFGNSDEIAVFRMDESGLEAVENASAIFLADRIEGSSGSAVTALVEGSRPILIEVQGLATMAAYGSPQRLATGYDRRRLAILAAILEKRAGFHCSQYDLFANIVGGITMADPAGDAALAVALTSSAYNRAVPAHTIFLGEIGLSGEIRRVAQAERRIIEAARMGFTSAYVAHTVRLKRPPQGIEIVPVATVSELLRLSLGIEASDTVGAPAVIPASPEAPHWKERGDKASSRAGKRAKRDPWRANRTSVSDE